ncbi:MAG: hypothetical protein ACPLY9_01570 [Nitrososphaerales archaeon]
MPDKVHGCYVRFQGLDIEKQTDRRAFLQSIVGSLCRRGLDATVAPIEVFDNFDIVVLNVNREVLSKVLSGYSNLSPQILENESYGKEVVESAWQNRVRIEVLKKNFLKIGDRYILKTDILNKESSYKRSYRIQASLENGYPCVWIDARTRIMLQLNEKEIDEADKMGEESEIKVRVLPNWLRGILIGRAGKTADEMEFPLRNRMLKTTEYWKVKHGIDFVTTKDEMLDVNIPSFGRTLPYPKSCVFKEFKERTKLPETLKKDPDERIKYVTEFVKTFLSSLHFLNQTISFEGPIVAESLSYQEYSYPSSNQMFVVAGTNAQAPVDKIHDLLKQYGPYAGKINGKYIAIHFGNTDETKQAIRYIEKTYRRLNLGELEPITEIGENGFIDTGGDKVADYTSAIAELRSKLITKKEKVLAIIVLPSIYAADIYYKSRDQLFERIFGTEPFPCQAIGYETVEKILQGDRSAYAIAANTASQCYIKFGGTGTAVWILKEPADSKIPGIIVGTSCYAYHDVSRRPKLKASATAYSAMTDSYGRYIATGTKPVGGEKLSPAAFYDILVDLIQRISIFSQRYIGIDGKKLSFSRFVFAKDGIIRDDEANMMEQVIMNGIPDEKKESIPELLKRIPMFPKSLIIDIIGVNKTPNKRIFDLKLGRYFNVPEGTAIAFNENEGLLVSCSSRTGTAQPVEISIKKHLCLNMNGVPRPHILQIMDEYYRLTKLNWSSLFKQGKYALPQILTQNLGENISAGVRVPDDMVLL